MDAAMPNLGVAMIEYNQDGHSLPLEELLTSSRCFSWLEKIRSKAGTIFFSIFDDQSTMSAFRPERFDAKSDGKAQRPPA